MKRIGLFDAKTRLSEIARRVKETGQPVRVTNRGEEMVDIVPVSDAAKSRSKSKAIAEINSLRGEIAKSSARQIRADIAKGRR